MDRNVKSLTDKCMDLSIRLIKKDIKSDIELLTEMQKVMSNDDILFVASQFILEKTIELLKSKGENAQDIMYR